MHGVIKRWMGHSSYISVSFQGPAVKCLLTEAFPQAPATQA